MSVRTGVPDGKVIRCAHLQCEPLPQLGLLSSGSKTLCFTIMKMNFQSCAGRRDVCQLYSVGWGAEGGRLGMQCFSSRLGELSCSSIVLELPPSLPPSPPVLRSRPPLKFTGAPVLLSRCPLRPPPELTSAVHPECLGSGSIGVTASQLCPSWLRTCSLGSLNWETDRHPSTSDAQTCGFRLLCCFVVALSLWFQTLKNSLHSSLVNLGQSGESTCTYLIWK